ncbi:hypothetical protein QUW37_06555 [Ligilactobacillus aviarius]|uniref:hypothetical protein n=1 Tax=Ligilactobacillus TaxID=2767887 RepID=UPI0025A3F8F5|nr:MULTISPECIES: hypothetical protein [Ligilactobacillus]MDM8278890.1 hypothetical protein [Ligilactobacillus aviarius]MDO3394034.1 hypothetical protein [Ligilactobacillus sp. 110_WCHN]
MEQKELIIKIANKLNSSKFNNDLISEITTCINLALNWEISTGSISYRLVSDMILSVLNMSEDVEGLVYMQPYNIVEYSLWYAFLMKKEKLNNKEHILLNTIKSVIDSSIFCESEWALPFKFRVYQNIYGEKGIPKELFRQCELDFNNLQDKSLLLNDDILEDTLLYYTYFYKNVSKDKRNSLVTYANMSDNQEIKNLIESIFKVDIKNMHYRDKVSDLFECMILKEKGNKDYE